MSMGCWSHQLKFKEGTGGNSLKSPAVIDVHLVIMVTMVSTGCYLFQQLPPTLSYFQTAICISQTHHLHSPGVI
jgi:hypothetical protein